MDMTQLINTLGFPIACVVACGTFIYIMWKQQMTDKEKLYVELEKSRETTSKATETTNKALEVIRAYANKLDIIESDVKEIKGKIVG